MAGVHCDNRKYVNNFGCKVFGSCEAVASPCGQRFFAAHIYPVQDRHILVQKLC